VGKSPWAPKKGPKKFLKIFFEKEYRRCVLKILTVALWHYREEGSEK